MEDQSDLKMDAVFEKVEKILVKLHKYREKQNQICQHDSRISHRNLHATKVLSLSIRPTSVKTTETIGCQTVRKVQFTLPQRNGQNSNNELKIKNKRVKTQFNNYHKLGTLIKSVAYLKQINLNSRILNQENTRNSRSKSKGLSLTSSRSHSKEKSKQMIKLTKRVKTNLRH